jgi:hypothetical protein
MTWNKWMILTLMAAAGTPLQAHPTKTTTTATASKELGDMRLTNVRLTEVARLLSQVGQANVVVTAKVAELEVSLYLHNATVDDMVRNTCRAAGVWFRYDQASRTYVIERRGIPERPGHRAR